MPRIYDNISLPLYPALQHSLENSVRADFSVGYFNLRGWQNIAATIDGWPGGDGHCVRLLIGMQKLPEDELRQEIGLHPQDGGLDGAAKKRMLRDVAESFRRQLVIGVPTNADEVSLQGLARQLKSRKVVVKLHLHFQLHAKLYLTYRKNDPDVSKVAYVGSSNLTMAGLGKQGELNVDVVEGDACDKLAAWFGARWDDPMSVDVTDELADIILESWARPDQLPPYQVYLKMAYHLAQDARAGLAQFKLPKEFEDQLFEFQERAVRIAASHVNRHGGVLIGDVVGLGKTIVASAIAKVFEVDQSLETLIICPSNLQEMWQDYVDTYHLRAKVLSLGLVQQILPDLAPYRAVIIDESHNLRNREGHRYKVIQDYLVRCSSKVILLTATPYNKQYKDLSNQLRLFVDAEQALGIRPDEALSSISETEFLRRHQCRVDSLAAFEHSESIDDWRQLMGMFLIRRTRTFIMKHYAQTDPETGRKYLELKSGFKSYFPDRMPRTLTFALDESDQSDEYARLYNNNVVDAIGSLELPRYGLGNYKNASPVSPATEAEQTVLHDLSRAGRRLMGFCITNLFKRLESGGQAFLQSLERHVLRNYVYEYAIDHGLPLPVGAQGADLMGFDGGEIDFEDSLLTESNDDDDETSATETLADACLIEDQQFFAAAASLYALYRSQKRRAFKWIRPDLFDTERLIRHLQADSHSLQTILRVGQPWRPESDTKLAVLVDIIQHQYAGEKVLVFTQFADTARYLGAELEKAGIQDLAVACGDSEHPTLLAWRFSPRSNKKVAVAQRLGEINTMVATDVLSEGQNLQDCHVVVNYDLPWAIIKLIQRAGRVDRIGQESPTIDCCSFWPADGVERLIRLRARLKRRLVENAQVLGTDEVFSEDDMPDETAAELYAEKPGVLDADEDDQDVDPVSYAYEIWNEALKRDPSLATRIPALPPVVYSAKSHGPDKSGPGGAIVFLKTGQGNDALAWVDEQGRVVSQSQLAILRAAECLPEEPSVARAENHHELVKRGVAWMIENEGRPGGQLGRPSGARFRTYTRLSRFINDGAGTLFVTDELRKATDEVYRYPLRPAATDMLNRQLKSDVSDQELAEAVAALYRDDRLCLVDDAVAQQEPEIVCSMGLVPDRREE